MQLSLECFRVGFLEAIHVGQWMIALEMASQLPARRECDRGAELRMPMNGQFPTRRKGHMQANGFFQL
jgi:hypothetical protein